MQYDCPVTCICWWHIIIGRSKEDITKSFIALQTSPDAKGLEVNEEKPKYMIVKGNRRQTMLHPYIKIMEYKSENLYSLVNENNWHEGRN